MTSHLGYHCGRCGLGVAYQGNLHQTNDTDSQVIFWRLGTPVIAIITNLNFSSFTVHDIGIKIQVNPSGKKNIIKISLYPSWELLINVSVF